MLGDRRLTQGAVRLAALVLLPACGADDAERRDAAGGVGGDDRAANASLSARRAERCDAGAASVLIDSIGIGPVLLRDRVAALAKRCPTTDTTLTLGEGLRERAHIATVRGHRLTLLSTGTADTSIIRVITTDPAFKTAGGVGVGSSVESLRTAHGRLCAAQGERNFVVLAADLPGVSFAIDWSPPPSRDPSVAETPFPGGDPGTALDQARITSLWVHGVSGGCRVGVG